MPIHNHSEPIHAFNKRKLTQSKAASETLESAVKVDSITDVEYISRKEDNLNDSEDVLAARKEIVHHRESDSFYSSAKHNFALLQQFSPEILTEEMDYIRFESEGFEPLYVERIAEDQIAVAHTFLQNGDVMLDPELVFFEDKAAQALYPLSYEQSALSVYLKIADPQDPSVPERPESATDINRFFASWMQHLYQQAYRPISGLKNLDSGRMEYVFSETRTISPQSVCKVNQHYTESEITKQQGFISETSTPASSEPLIDHPELHRRDLSRQGRRDKVILTDLMFHYITYRFSYAAQMPPMSPSDTAAWTSQREALEALTVSDVLEENRKMIQSYLSYFNRWLFPFSEQVADHVRAELENVTDAAISFQKQYNVVASEYVPVRPSYLSEILRHDPDTKHAWVDLASFFEQHEEMAERIPFLRSHFGDVYTMFFASDHKTIGYHATEDYFEVWEGSYIEAKAKEKLSWQEVCGLIEAELAVDRQNDPYSYGHEPSLFDFEDEGPTSSLDALISSAEMRNQSQNDALESSQINFDSVLHK